MKYSRHIFVLFCAVGIALLAVHTARAETSEEARRRELQQLYQQLEERQEQLRGELDATREQKESLQKAVTQIRGQINYLESKIQATEAKIELTDIEIGDIEQSIGQTQKQIEERRGAISKLIALRDQHDQEALVATLVRFSHVSDFFQRLEEITAVHTRLLGLISELKGYRVALELDRESLEDKKEGLQELSQEQEHQQSGLIQAKSGKDRLLSETKGQESAYQKQVEEIERQKEALFKELRELELKIIHGGLYIVRIKAEQVPPAGTHLFQRPAGKITQGYGMTTYARRGAYGGAPHNGVDISAGYGSPIRAIGEGTIVANGSNKGWGNWVAIGHPNNMVSVYAHMSSLAVLSIGSQLAAGQVIGYEGKTGKSTGSHLHVSLYREFFTYLNDKDGELYFNYFEGSLSPCSYMNCN